MRSKYKKCPVAKSYCEYHTYLKANKVNDLALTPKKKHLPKDILCAVWGSDDSVDNGEVTYRYTDGCGGFFVDGAASKTETRSQHWDNYKVLKQEPKPWFNDAECPIPEGLKYRVFRNCKWQESSKYIVWMPDKATSEDTYYPITAYQILGATNET